MSDTLFDLNALPKGPTRQEVLDAWKKLHGVKAYQFQHWKYCGQWIAVDADTRNHDPDLSEDEYMVERMGRLGHAPSLSEFEACDVFANRRHIAVCDFTSLLHLKDGS